MRLSQLLKKYEKSEPMNDSSRSLQLEVLMGKNVSKKDDKKKKKKSMSYEYR